MRRSERLSRPGESLPCLIRPHPVSQWSNTGIGQPSSLPAWRALHAIGVVPSWAWARFLADKDAVIFTFSDRAAQEKLGIWREDRR